VLRRRGILKRIRKARGHEPAIYVREGVEYDPPPFEDMTLPEVVCDVLGDRSMTAVELVVGMLEAGYETTMSRNALLDGVGVVLRKGKFVAKGRKWAAKSFK